MLEKFIAEGNPKKVEEIDSATLDLYSDKLPQEIIFLLKNYGISNYLEGFFWMVNPKDYQAVSDEIYVPLTNPSVCFGRDAFGCLYVWEDKSIIYIDVRYNYTKVIGRKPAIFFNNIMTDWDYLSTEIKQKNFKEAKEKLGSLAFDECFGYVPLLALGGAEEVENLQKVKIIEHISLIARMTDKIV